MATNGFVGFNASEALYTTPNVPSPSVSSLVYRVFFADDDDVTTTTTTTTTMAFCGDFVYSINGLFFEFPPFFERKKIVLDERVARLARRKMSNSSPPAPAPTPANRSPLNVEAGVVRPGRRDGHASAQKNVIDETLIKTRRRRRRKRLKCRR